MYVKLLFGIVVSVASMARAAGQNVNTCAEVHQALKVPQRLIPGNKINVGFINACICLDDVYNFVSSDPVALVGARFAGKSYVISAITNMIKSQGRVCHYPDHAVGACMKGNPCKFDCTDGYQPFPKKNPTQCVCNKPYTECNGKCGKYQGCPSARPHNRRSNYFLCPEGKTACGMLGRGAQTWECIDTDNDLESCGGCLIPLAGEMGGGVDCSVLEGSVACVGGKCVTSGSSIYL